MRFATEPRTARRFRQKTARAALKAVAAAVCIASGTLAQAADASKIGLGLPLLTSPFWQSYNNYLPRYAKELGIDIRVSLHEE